MYIIQKIVNNEWVNCKRQEYQILSNALKRARYFSKAYGLTRVIDQDYKVIQTYREGKKYELHQ